MKRCTKCGEEKPLEAFYIDRRAKDRLQGQCKKCAAAYYQANRTTIISKQKVRSTTTLSQKSEYDKARYQSNRPAILERAKTYREANRTAIAKRKKHYRAANKSTTRAAATRQVTNLTDGYIRQRICASSTLRAADIPDWLIEAKRAQLQLKRETRQ